MKNNSNLVLTMLLVGCSFVIFCTTCSVQAAVISWGTVTDYSSANDVSTEGATVEAINACGSGCMVSPLVNGVQFTASSTVMSLDPCATFLYGDTGDSGYNNLLNTFDNGSEPFSVGGGLLEIDKDYLIQIWYLDERSSWDHREMQYGDGHGNLSDPLNDQYVIGAFTADGTTQTITVTGINTSTPHITAYQIRLLGPVPTLSTSAGSTVSGNFTVDVDFTEAVTGLDESDFSVVNGTVVTASLSGSGNSYSIEINPAANGDVVVTLPADSVMDTDGDSHFNSKSNTLVTTYVSPGSDQPVPTLSSSTQGDVYGDYVVDISFSEPVTGLELSDFAIHHGTVSNFSGSGATYSVVVSPNFGGEVTVSLPSNSVTDTDDSLPNIASNELKATYHVEVTVSSPAELLAYLPQSNVQATLSPGIYTIDASDVANTFGTPRFEFSGNNNTYDFTGVTINFAADVYTSGLSMNHIQILGNDNILKNLTMVDLCSKYGDKVNGGVNIKMDGQNNRIEGFHMTIRGSYPYGYGDAFGKGASYTIKHYKHSALLVRGESNHVKNCTLIHRSFGHAIFTQAANNALIEGCYVEGEVRTTDDMLTETSGPAYDIGFLTDYGYTLPAGYMMSLGEQGIRAYNGGTTYINGESISRSSSNVTVRDCTIIRMRGGVILNHSSGTNTVSGCTVTECEIGYAVGGSSSVTDSSGDAKYGPVWWNFYTSESNSDIDITVLSNSGAYNGSGALAYIGGSNNNITLRSSESSAEPNLIVMVSGDFEDFRHLNGVNPGSDDLTSTNIEINNFTQYPLVLAEKCTAATGQSCGSITDNGSGNVIDQIECIVEEPNSVAIGNVVTFNLGTGTLAMWQSNGALVWETTGIADSYQIEIGPDGNVYLGGWTSDVVRVYNGQTGEFLNNISLSGERCLDLAFADNGDLYVATNDTYVSMLTSASGYTDQSTFATGMFTRKAYSLDFGVDVTGDGVDELYVLDGGESNTGNSVRVINGATGAEVPSSSWVASLVNRPYDLECGSDGRVYIGGRNTANVAIYNADGTGGQSVTDAAGISNPYQLAEGPVGEWYVANRNAVTGTTNAATTLYTANFSTFDSVLVEGASGSNFTGVAVVPSPYAGDLTYDGEVNLEDVARLSKGWQSVYIMDNLIDIANDWLDGQF